jgi:nitroreductase
MRDIPPHVRAILDLARWAPSGDNTQPWRFEVLDEQHLRVHGHDTRDHCVYDLDGHPSHLAHGALLETLAIAAMAHGYRAHIARGANDTDSNPIYEVRLEAVAGVAPDPLIPWIEKRVVQRRPMSTRPVTPEQRRALGAALPEGYALRWFEPWAERWRIAKLCFDNAKIRLTLPEAYEVHKAIIDWDTRYSEDKIPDQALGADAVNLRFMHWALASWPRIHFLNTWLLGHLMPRIQLDLLPGLRCAAHVALLAPKGLASLEDYVEAGRVMQRFWLTAASQGLFLQPEMTPLIFSRYHREGRAFTSNRTALRMAGQLNGRLAEIVGPGRVDAVFFLARLGSGPAPKARSLRKRVDALLV